jgi:Zn-dependent protease
MSNRTSRFRSVEIGGIRFGRTEIRDLLLAWLALGVAFTFFLGIREPIQRADIQTAEIARLFVLSMLTVGTGFLLHEIAHKVMAVRFDQIAAFRADYGMLAVAIAAGLAGFLFAAPGAVYHRGQITGRQNGIIAAAGPVTNLALATVSLPLFLVGPGIVSELGRWGLLVNCFLAAFNMVPFGPLDGNTVIAWSKQAFALIFGVSAGACLVLFLYVL